MAGSQSRELELEQSQRPKYRINLAFESMGNSKRIRIRFQRPKTKILIEVTPDTDILVSAEKNIRKRSFNPS